MPFNRPSVETIYDRMKADMESRLTGDVKIARFSLLGILIKIFAGAIHLAYGLGVFFANQLFPDTAEDDFLERQANLRGLTRKAATFASGEITITGTDGTNIPQGTEYQDSNGNIYLTLVGASISGGSVEVAVEAEVAGSAGNTSAVSLEIVSPIAGADDIAIISSVIGGGAEEENDDEFRQRLILFIQEPVAGGRKSDYEQWALEIAGVDNAWAFDSNPSAGFVTVAVADADNKPVDPVILQAADDNIESNRPLGVISQAVNVELAEFEFELSISPNTPDVQTAINNSITELFRDNSIPGTILLISQIRASITNAGAVDYTIDVLKKNGISLPVDQNIDLQGFEVPSLSSIVFGDL